MSERRKQYPFDEIEQKWQARWADEKTFATPNPGDAEFDASRPKFYALDMFPYPSGEGLHVGHPEGYTATDILSRYKRKKGFNVLHPMGWDAFGLPAEQYAIKTGQHPRVTTEANVEKFKGQLNRIGFAYDWEREVNTTDPDYFKWTQWIFLKLYNSYFDEETQKARPIEELGDAPDIDAKRLAYVSEVAVNWCPELGTVLANEEVVDGKSEVGGFPVERRPMRQWMLRITAYGNRLIDELEDLDWSDGIKALQRNWIGRSEGADVTFEVPGADQKITVFTTRPDTLFGATYMVLAPEHELVDQITGDEQRAAVEAYKKEVAGKSDLERTDLADGKTGVFTGGHAINPVNGEQIPIWIADYVLISYGTGAIMAVPAHDERDFEFATKFGIPIHEVVSEGRTGVPPVPKNTPAFKDDISETEVTERHLPHWKQDAKTYFITWRLADSLPRKKLDQLAEERDGWLAENPKPWTDEQESEYYQRFSDQIDEWLDAGEGSCILRDPENAAIVGDALRHFDGERYTLHAAVVMPNHVHVLVELAEGEDLSKVLHSWKSFTAKKLNEKTKETGQVWQEEYFDRLIRNQDHFNATRRYIGANPSRAGLAEGDYWLFEAGSGTGGTPVLPFSDHGFAVNSGFLDGLSTADAKSKMNDWLEENGHGKRAINFKLRDWLFARQRYWGEPFPIIWEDGKHRAVDLSELPVEPPEMDDFKPTGTADPPLSKATDWVNYSETAQRETNTMPQWAGSCWYYLRYCDAQNGEAFVGEDAEKYWMGDGDGKSGGVDIYVGGTEHAVLHLLYARFWHKVLFDLGYVSKPEPFQRLVNQGMILGEDNQKMSKSRGNVINPDDVIGDFGADSLRLYEMFMGPLEQVKPWSTKGVEGVYRFLGRTWRLFTDTDTEGNVSLSEKIADVEPTKKQLKVLHETIKKVTGDTESLAFNTAISQMMVCVNEFTQAEERSASALATFLQLLNPYAPHLSEELNERLAAKFDSVSSDPLADQPWPEHDESFLVEDEIEMAVQVNGKLRDKITVATDASKEAVEEQALASEKVKSFTDGKTVRKVIVVPGRLVNVVAN